MKSVPLAKILGDILKEIVASRNHYPNPLIRTKARQVRRLACEGWLHHLDRAVGKSARRQKAAACLLAELADLPEVAERYHAWLQDPDLEWRGKVIELVGRWRLVQFAPLLNDAIEGKADGLRQAYAVTSAGELRAECCLPGILALAADLDTPLRNRLLWALKDYGHPSSRRILKEFYRGISSKRDRVIAAWALGKIGDKVAVRYLVKMLDDPDIRTPTSFQPGAARRAAEALCDIHGWKFEWLPECVEKTRKRWNRLVKTR
jgi:HEAT repeat protein